MTNLPMPDFTYDPARNRARINERFSVQTGVTGFSAASEWCRIDSDGLVTGSPGYEYDFATGAIDTVTMVVPSFAHDIICQLTDEGLIPWSARKKGDKAFRRLMRQYGVFFPRWLWCYLAVRVNSIRAGIERKWSS